MVEFMEMHPDIARHNAKRNTFRTELVKKWEELTRMLNDKGPPRRSWRDWNVIWVVLKSNTTLKFHQGKTGDFNAFKTRVHNLLSKSQKFISSPSVSKLPPNLAIITRTYFPASSENDNLSSVIIKEETTVQDCQQSMMIDDSNINGESEILPKIMEENDAGPSGVENVLPKTPISCEDPSKLVPNDSTEHQEEEPNLTNNEKILQVWENIYLLLEDNMSLKQRQIRLEEERLKLEERNTNLEGRRMAVEEHRRAMEKERLDIEKERLEIDKRRLEIEEKQFERMHSK
ncbi:hypothetical protein DMENIID0001_093330 [Sergentomyia squamirostris]